MPLDTTRFRALLIARYGSISEAARQLGKQPGNLNKLVNGRKSDLRVSEVDAWAKLLECRTRDLIQ